MQHFVQYYPQSPNIALLGINVLSKSLGRHVFWRPDIVVDLRSVGNILLSAVSEIYETDLFICGVHIINVLTILMPENEVIGFDIPVHDALTLDGLIGLEHLSEEVAGLLFGQSIGIVSDIFG